MDRHSTSLDCEKKQLPKKSTDWSKCCLCQEQSSEALQCPARSKRVDTGQGYKTLSENVKKFHQLGSIPLNLNISRLDEGNGIEHCLQNNQASWHKSCYLKFKTSKLKRAEKKRQCTDVTDEYGPPKSKRKKSTSVQENICFFCDVQGKPGELHNVETFQVDNRVRECALQLQDKTLLAKLSAGDLIAQEAKYHTNCLLNLYRKAKYKYTEDTTSPDEAVSHSLAFAQLVEYIEECRMTEHIPVFRLADLTKLYAELLEDFNIGSESRTHSKRLKNKLLHHFPDLQAHQDGRDILLVFDEHLGTALKDAYRESSDDEAIHLAKAARIVRRDLFQIQLNFSGSFDEDCQGNSVPQSLVALVLMILEGPNIKFRNKAKRQTALSIAQLLGFNSCKRQREVTSGKAHHDKHRETPLPLYLGLTLYAKTRKRDLIDMLFDLGLSVSYDRVLEVTTDLASKACAMYEQNQVVCPTKFRKNLFTTSAIDNIDHNPSATSAQSSFHGTGISLFQHPTFDNLGTICLPKAMELPKRNSKTVPELPSFFADVPPAILKPAAICPPDQSGAVPFISDEELLRAEDYEKRWCKYVNIADADTCTNDVHVSWGAYHANHQEKDVTAPPAISSLLPLFHDQSKSASMIKHSMNMVKLAIEHVNPGQVPVIAVDQPLFAIAKQVQWQWPHTHGDQKFVILLGGLHIEMAFMKVLGDWLRDSGWVELLVEAEVTSPGTADSFLSAKHVGRTRRAHQVTVCVLHYLLQKAYDEYSAAEEEGDQSQSFEDWCSKLAGTSPTFQYWWITLHMELMLLVFVRSLREGNFNLYMQVLNTMIPWFFALDHLHYARWLPVHMCDMTLLHKTCPEVAIEFNKGHFVVNKTTHTFSKIPIDQAHEQNNALVKGEGGVVGLTENPAALRRWTVGGPELARVIQEFEHSLDSTQATDNSGYHSSHHEQTMSYQATFLKHVQSLKHVMEKYGNPFMEHTDELIILQSKDVVAQTVNNTLKNVEKIGIEQYQNYLKERLIEKSIPFSQPIKKNKLSLISCPSVNAVKSSLQIACLKNDCSLFSRLYIACQSRESNIEEFFKHENQPYPPAISQYGHLKTCVKSDLLQCLEDLAVPPDEKPEVDVAILDGAAVINMLKPGVAKTFEAYAHDVVIPHIKMQLESATKRLDIVWDDYRPDSLKAMARETRGKGLRRRVDAKTLIPGKWQDFLHVNENKRELFEYLAKEMLAIKSEKQIITTFGEHVLCHLPYDTEGLQPCLHKEADTRMMVHMSDAVKHGCQRVLLRTIDTDVVVLAVAAMSHLNNEVWVAFGTGNNFRFLAVHEIAAALGPSRSISLPIFHSLTGCDTVSSFNGIGKKTAWKVWQTYDEVTSSFLALSHAPAHIADEDMAMIEHFVVLLYDRTSDQIEVNVARQQLFSLKNRAIDHIPPTQAALAQHVRRAVYQGGYIWGQALIKVPELPDPQDWGWMKNDVGQWEPLWTTLPQAAQACYELLSCGCTKGCKRRCKCAKAALRCTALCKCGGQCGNEQ